jgi:regulator of PEP synthase PpsR (kinase-PPPase family)
MDDGANPQNWHQADLLILGVSRSGKTPLSIYLGQRGYKVANLPLVPNAPIPKELFEIDQDKIVGLLIDGVLLASIRRTRVGSMGLDELKSYTNTRGINEELKWAQGLYAEHPEWPVIDVTFRGVEETAARILAILDERSRQEGKLAAVLPFSV